MAMPLIKPSLQRHKSLTFVRYSRIIFNEEEDNSCREFLVLCGCCPSPKTLRYSLNRFFSLPSGAVKTAPPFYAITENPGRMPFLVKITKGLSDKSDF